jgi:hypothetical protein
MSVNLAIAASDTAARTRITAAVHDNSDLELLLNSGRERRPMDLDLLSITRR